MYFKYPINDPHIHVFTPQAARQALDMVKELGYEKFALLSGCSYFSEYMGNNLLCAAVKMESPQNAYAFAAVHYPEIGAPSAQDMLNQVGLYYSLGFDGIKMLDGKPSMRKRIGIPLNHPSYDPMFQFMESVDMPLLYHVNDPDEFWHWEQMPEWAKKMGDSVYYGDGTYPSKEQIEQEAVDILQKHPNLRVVFPHFFFTSKSLPRTKELLDTYPNLSYDITPGWEMFESFSQNYTEWRSFFIDYSDRILFGSDTISDHWRQTIDALRRVLETDEEFTAFEESCKGLKLADSSLRNIYKHNSDRFLPTNPNTMNKQGLEAYGQSILLQAEALAGPLKTQAIDSIQEALALVQNPGWSQSPGA